MSDDIFVDVASTPAIDPERDYSPELIGEGKRYTDQKAAARALLEKDAFIEKLKKEAQEARAAVQNGIKMEEFIDKLNALQTVTPPVREPTPPVEGDRLKLEDIDARVEAIAAQRDAENTKKRNLMEVRDTLQGRFGDAFPSVVEDKARQLGLGKEFLNDLAARQPKAFFALIGVEAKTPVSSAPPRSVVSSEGFKPSGDEKTNSYYQKLLRDDRSKYFSQETQLEMHKQAQKLGPDFYK